MTTRRAALFFIVAIAVLTGTVTMAGTAQTSTNGDSQNPTVSYGVAEFVTVNTSYPHPAEDTQGVEVMVRIEPDEQITDVYINVSNSNTGFVDFSEEFSREIKAGSISSVPSTDKFPGGVHIRSFYISQLNAGESVTISFTAYPTQVNQQNLDVATVRYEYVRNGQLIPDSAPEKLSATASLAESPHFQLQATKNTVDQLRLQIKGMWATVGGGALLGLLGVVLLIYTRLSDDGSGLNPSNVKRELQAIERLADGQAKERTKQAKEKLLGDGGTRDRGSTSTESDDDDKLM